MGHVQASLAEALFDWAGRPGGGPVAVLLPAGPDPGGRDRRVTLGVKQMIANVLVKGILFDSEITAQTDHGSLKIEGESLIVLMLLSYYLLVITSIFVTFLYLKS